MHLLLSIARFGTGWLQLTKGFFQSLDGMLLIARFRYVKREESLVFSIFFGCFSSSFLLSKGCCLNAYELLLEPRRRWRSR